MTKTVLTASEWGFEDLGTCLELASGLWYAMPPQFLTDTPDSLVLEVFVVAWGLACL